LINRNVIYLQSHRQVSQRRKQPHLKIKYEMQPALATVKSSDNQYSAWLMTILPSCQTLQAMHLL